jgi:glycosyltransferase involved in cell wall biosynthesis
MIKVGFHLIGDERWHAGFVYLGNLLRALRRHAENDVTLCLMVRDRQSRVPEDLLHEAHEIVVYPKYRRWTLSWFVGRGTSRIFGHDLWSDSALKQFGVQIIAFGTAPHGTSMPVLAWLPDFQHIHLREMFSDEESRNRDHHFKFLAATSTRVILLSEFVRHDFATFFPEHKYKARVIRPVSHIPSAAYETDPVGITKIYSLPEKFIYLPNQFWKHKNHRAVFHALRILKDRGTKPFLVCSGSLHDYRHPHYSGQLLQEISEWGIRNQIAFLGLIPREHVYLMMRQSLCILNPSLFEGFGLAVDEARSVGKRVLLSDIEVHREQDPPKGVFFNPTDEEDLAEKIGKVWEETTPGPDWELEEMARRHQPMRMAAFAGSFMSVVKEAMDSHS